MIAGGVFMLAVFFVPLFVLAARAIGWKKTLAAVATVVVLAFWVTTATLLIVRGIK